MKRVLLTGASGFIGRHAIAPLLKCGYEIHAVSSRQVDRRDEAVHWHLTNLLDGSDVQRLMVEVRPTHLLHFAWYAEPGEFWSATENFQWLEASIALLRHFHDSGGSRVVMAGTCAEYDWDHGYCTEGVTPCRPQTAYGVCKNALREIFEAYCTQHGVSGAWGRIFFLYGPHEDPRRLVGSVIGSLLRGESARCTHGKQIRDFMHVEDVASAFTALLDSAADGALNISSGQPVSLRDVVLTAAGLLGCAEQVEFGAVPAPANEPALLVGNCRRLAEEINWSPRFDINSGFANTVDWWKRKLSDGL